MDYVINGNKNIKKMTQHKQKQEYNITEIQEKIYGILSKLTGMNK